MGCSLNPTHYRSFRLPDFAQQIDQTNATSSPCWGVVDTPYIPIMAKKNAKVRSWREMANARRMRYRYRAITTRALCCLGLGSHVNLTQVGGNGQRSSLEQGSSSVFSYHMSETSMGIRWLRLVQGMDGYRQQTSQVWTNTRIDIPRKPAHINVYQKFCEECIQRTGELPLDVYIGSRRSSISIY